MPATLEPGVRLQLLRDPQLHHAEGRSTPLNANDAALLALLAVDGPASRERTILLLWPDETDPARARNALRQRLFRLRRVAGCDLVSGEETIRLAPGIEHDLEALEPALAADPASAAHGDLLGNLHYDELVDFSTWLDAARAAWRSRRRDTLAAIASRLEADDQIAAALLCAERIGRDEPLYEHGLRRLMRLHYRRGDRGAALAAFAEFQTALAAALGERPSAETEALRRQIEGSGALPVAAAPASVTLLRPPRLVGRAREWAHIEAAMSAGRIVALTGEPGIGKSRLLNDVAAAHATAVVQARPGDARVPYALLGRIVQAVAALADVERWPAWVRTELALLAPQLGAAASGPVESRRLQQAVESLFAAPGPQATRLAIDDLQFADDASLDMLPAFTGPTGAWLLAWRGHEQPVALGAWLDAIDGATLERIELEALDQAAVAELLTSLALPGVDGPGWAARVHQHSGGNPLFTIETLRTLLARGGAASGAAGGGALPLPDTLRRLIEKRLAQLPAPALKLARVAALAGPDLTVDLAATVLGVHALDLHDAWHALEAAQIMQGRVFVHDLFYEVTRDAVPAALRQWLHGRIAGGLDAAGAGAPARVAQHWQLADEPARAASAYARAAAAAAAVGRLAEQCRWLEAEAQSHQLAGNAAARFDALHRHAIVAREARSPAQAMQAARALVDVAIDARQRGLAHLQVAQCQLNAARFDRALPDFDSAIAQAAQAGDEHTAQHARYLRALALAQTRGADAALAAIEPLAGWAEALDDASLQHSFLADFAIVCDQADQRRRARPMFERALAYFDRTRETGNAAPTRMMFARSLMALGNLAQAQTLLEAAVRGRNELSDGEGGDGIEVLNLGRVYCELGWYAEGLQLLEALHARLADRGSVVVCAAAALVMARIHAHLGQAARAMAWLNGLPPEAPFHQRAAALWTHALLIQDRPPQRADKLDAALAQISSGADLPYLRLPIQFDRLGCRPTADNAADSAAALRAGVAECERRELPAVQMLGRMRLVQVLSAQGDGATALLVARDLLHDLRHCHPLGTYLPELYAACRTAALLGADTLLAQQCQDRAVQWIAATSQAHVPPSFRDSFAHRNPVNRLILTTTLDGPA